MPGVSIIVCTYNPVEHIFSRCLDALTKAISVRKPDEIIIVDNNSTTPLAEQDYIKRFIDLHANVSIVNESKQGLTPARLKGISLATSDLLVYVDDDNIVAPDFIEMGLQVAVDNPHIGAWSGQVKLEFEKTPEPWTKKYWGLLVHREFDRDYWSNLPHLGETMPCGAGLFIRKTVADYYYQIHKSGKRNIQLDRDGKSLFSGGDNDMAACACDLGLGVGLFHKIVVTHYIPPFRVEKEYLLRLAEGIAASAVVFRSFRGEYATEPSMKNRLAYHLRCILKNPIDRAFYQAVTRGEKAGLKMIRN
ncbi:glycosyltransferase [Longitalea arenae]|uniref:glycosyltransferase n=1 Tax=Longitalea arenae TaxID=2812558 RepID=UPI001966DA7A|nr:glycosyltransferase [Longitalea arenae]